MASYDVIVLGTGGIGSAAVSHLARRGARVLGLDQFSHVHNRGSSHGRTRMTRQAYFEHPDYVPLVQRSYKLWDELSERRSIRLFFPSGLLSIGRPNGAILPGVIESAQQHNLQIEQLSAAEVRRRWCGFALPDELGGVYEPGAGYLLVEHCVRAYLDDARAAGAELHADEPVLDVQPSPQEIVVRTPRGQYTAKRLVITAGAWAGRWLGDLELRLVVRRKPVFWFSTRSRDYRADAGVPAFLYEFGDNIFYGFPEIDAGEIKISEHTRGLPVDDPTNVDRAIHAADLAPIAEYISACMPGVSERVIMSQVCLYTMSPDEHFIVDRLPTDERIAFVAGLSGHGFKFAPVLGEALADLTLAGRTALPIGFLSCQRPGLSMR